MTRVFEPIDSTWCPGCGDFAVLSSLRKAITDLEIRTENLVMVTGIGCSGGIQNFMLNYGYHALHGRLLSTATGIKLANPKLTVIAAGGDGDAYAIGMGHFMHTLRRNVGIVYIVMNNETYGLTKGQPSPTSKPGFEGNVEEPFDAALAALAVRATTFIARGFSGKPDQLTALLKQAIQHAQEGRGLAFLEVLSPCVTFNDTYKFWRQISHDVAEEHDYNPNDRIRMIGITLKVLESGRIPIGLIYQGDGISYERKVLLNLETAPVNTDIDIKKNLNAYKEILTLFK